MVKDVLDDEVAPLDPTELGHALAERVDQRAAIGRIRVVEEPDARDRRHLLRSDRAGSDEAREGDGDDERAAMHSYEAS
jgi:hypothetical protein